MTAKFRIDSADTFSPIYFLGSHIGDSITYILATSYLNFLITNNVVLMPSYWKEGRSQSVKVKDAQAREIMEKLFPGRKIIQVNVEGLNQGWRNSLCYATTTGRRMKAETNASAECLTFIIYSSAIRNRHATHSRSTWE